MTVGMQNVMNSRYAPEGPTLPETGNVEVCVSLPPVVVEAVGHYLDDHPQMSWDDVATLGLLLVAMPNNGDTRALHREYLDRMFGKVAA